MTNFLAEDRVTRRAFDSSDTYDQWLSFIARHIFEYKFLEGPPRDQHLHLDATARTYKGWSIGRVTTRLGRVHLFRGANELSRTARGRYAVYVSVTGEIEFEQFHRNSRLMPQFLTMISGTEDLSQRKSSTDNDTVIFTMPGEFVNQQLAKVDEACSRPTSASLGVGRLAHEAILSFQQTSGTMEETEFESAARILGELILLAFGKTGGVPSSNRSVRATTLARVKRKIQGRLTDPDLQLFDVAKECGISLSYLHTLFRDEGLTAWEYLKLARLQRARWQLELASTNGARVIDIALACGFSNVSHFSTAFKGAFSVTPSDILHAVKREKINS
jgi:AraC-like DNA-binding protein